MDKIVLFDIDKTIFDREKYLGDFFKILSSEHGLTVEQMEKVKGFYGQIKEDYGFFTSEAFLARIYEHFPQVSGKMNYYFKPENLDSFLFEDANVLKEIIDARLGIFSKGDTQLQMAKIASIKELFEDNLIYIFHDKLENLPLIIEKHKDSELTFVDDNLATLINAKDLNSEVRTILIDRMGEMEKVNQIDFKLSSLSGIIPILIGQY